MQYRFHRQPPTLGDNECSLHKFSSFFPYVVRTRRLATFFPCLFYTFWMSVRKFNIKDFLPFIMCTHSKAVVVVFESKTHMHIQTELSVRLHNCNQTPFWCIQSRDAFIEISSDNRFSNGPFEPHIYIQIHLHSHKSYLHFIQSFYTFYGFWSSLCKYEIQYTHFIFNRTCIQLQGSKFFWWTFPHIHIQLVCMITCLKCVCILVRLFWWSVGGWIMISIP